MHIVATLRCSMNNYKIAYMFSADTICVFETLVFSVLYPQTRKPWIWRVIREYNKDKELFSKRIMAEDMPRHKNKNILCSKGTKSQ